MNFIGSGFKHGTHDVRALNKIQYFLKSTLILNSILYYDETIKVKNDIVRQGVSPAEMPVFTEKYLQ